MSGCVTRIEFDRALKLAFTGWPVPLMNGSRETQSCMAFGEGVIQPQCFSRGPFPFSVRFVRKNVATVAQGPIGLPNTRIDQGIARIDLDCFFEILDSAL